METQNPKVKMLDHQTPEFKTFGKSKCWKKRSKNHKFKILERQNSELKIMESQNPELEILETHNTDLKILKRQNPKFKF